MTEKVAYRVTGGRYALQPQPIEGRLQVEVLLRDRQYLLGLCRRGSRGPRLLLLLRLLLDGRRSHEVGRLLLLLRKVARHRRCDRGLGHLLLLLIVAVVSGRSLIRGWIVKPAEVHFIGRVT